MALFGAAYLSRKWLAVFIPLLALWISSVILDNTIYAAYYEGFVWFSNGLVYLALLAIVGLGMLTLKKITPARLFGVSLSASLLFFLVTNFGSWMSMPIYTKDFSGLLQAYAAGLPFLRDTLLGDLFYVGGLFGAYETLKARYPQLAGQKA
jgi:hypothetical protein